MMAELILIRTDSKSHDIRKDFEIVNYCYEFEPNRLGQFFFGNDVADIVIVNDERHLNIVILLLQHMELLYLNMFFSLTLC